MRALFTNLFNQLRALLSRGAGSAMVSGFVLVAMLTMGAKVVSFLKDAAVAHQFGTGDALDAYMLSFGLLSFGAALIGGGLPEAFLPLYAEAIHKRGRRRAQRLAIQSTLLHLGSLLVIAGSLYFGAPWLMHVLSRGFSHEKQGLAVDLLRSLLPFMVCFGTSYQLSTWLRADKHFTVASSAPMLIPLTIIGALLIAKGGTTVDTLVMGTVTGAALHLAVLVIVVGRDLRAAKHGRLFHLRLWEPKVRQVVRNTIPYLIAGGIFSSAAVVDQAMASWLAPGSVAVLSYTDKICGIILALTALPACDVLFPYFADKVARADWAGVRKQLFTSIFWITGAALPAVAVLILLAPWIIHLLFERGSFTAQDTERVAVVLRFAALQIPFYIIGSLAARVVVALQATKFIMVLSTIGLVGNAVLNLFLMRTMGAAGIALATALVQMLSATMGCVFVLRQIRRRVEAGADKDKPETMLFLIRDLGYGGAQRQLCLLAKGLAEQKGRQVAVMHFYPGPMEVELQSAGVQTICVGKRHRWDLIGFFWRLVEAAQKVRPSVIHGYLAESNLMALCLKPFCGFPKVIWGVRDSQTDADTWGLLGKLSFRLNCLLSGRADLIIANSYSGRAYYLRQGYPSKHFVVVPNGIDTERYRPATVRSEGALVFGHVGRLHPMKDHETFLRAAAVVAKQVPDCKFVCIGKGEADYTAKLHALADGLGLGGRLLWSEPRADMPEVYRSLGVLVSSSAYGEGFSNVIGEAMASGVPCIGSDVGDSAKLVGDAASVFPAGDVEALVACMMRMAGLSTGERAVLGQGVRERMMEEFGVTKLVERTDALCQKALGGAPVIGGTARHVCVITTGLGTGGAEMMLKQILTGLNRERFVFTVLSLTPGGKHVEPLRAAGIEVHTLGMAAGRPSPAALWRLMKLVRCLQPDVLAGWMYHGCLAAWLGRVFLLRKVPVLWNVRQSLYSLAYEKRGSAMVIRLLAWLSGFATRITYNSQVSARQHEKIGYRRSRTRLVPNGFDTTLFQPGPRVAVAGLPLDAPWIGRFGRWAAMKDYATFLEAAALIHQTHPLAQFVLVGTGVDGVNAELVGQVERLGLKGCVHLLGERADIPQLTASLTLAVSSSAFGEGFPNVVGEAMACAVPVVATDVGDTAWVMGDTGRLVLARDAEAMAKVCRELLNLPAEELHRLGMAGRVRVVEHFSLGSVLQHFDELFTAETRPPLVAGAEVLVSPSP